jgi:hypothetical protein
VKVLVFEIIFEMTDDKGGTNKFVLCYPAQMAAEAAKTVASQYHKADGFVIRAVSIVGYIEVPGFTGTLGEGPERKMVKNGIVQ